MNGRSRLLTGQTGEYLVAAELCRRGYHATTFTRNVPAYDIIATDEEGSIAFIQVKAIRGRGWQFDMRSFAEVNVEGDRQSVGRKMAEPWPKLICVLVALKAYATDEFYVLTWRQLQGVAVAAYKQHLAKHGQARPIKAESTHLAITLEQIARYRDNWRLLGKVLVR